MRRALLSFAICFLAVSALFAEELIGITNVSAGTSNEIENPFNPQGKICTFINVFIKTPVMIVIFLVFLLGVATISGAAFPQWRDYGSKMILGSIGAAVLYILGMSALKFLTGVTVCGL